MNQILFVQDKRGGNTIDTKKIVLFFAVTLIIFGLILFGEGVYGVYTKSSNNSSNSESNTTNIQLSQNESGEIVITIDSQTIISDLIYNWNSEASQTISGNGRTQIQETITAPAGQNTLTVKTIDVNGKQTVEQQTFTLNVSKPEISLSVIDNKNVKISVTSTTDLSYITYKWNSEEEQKMDMTTYEDKTKFEKEIEIPTGQNTLYITAVDIYENKSDKSLEIKGVAKPTIEPTVTGQDFKFEVTSESDDLKQIEIQFNGQNYIITEDVIKASKDPKKISYTFKMVEGVNYLTVKATTSEGATEQKSWQYKYINQ